MYKETWIESQWGSESDLLPHVEDDLRAEGVHGMIERLRAIGLIEECIKDEANASFPWCGRRILRIFRINGSQFYEVFVQGLQVPVIVEVFVENDIAVQADEEIIFQR